MHFDTVRSQLTVIFTSRQNEKKLICQTIDAFGMLCYNPIVRQIGNEDYDYPTRSQLYAISYNG